MGYTVILKQGNVVEEHADFIVNASNTKLLLGSGVSMAFKRTCGIVLQQEMDRIIQNNILQKGDVAITSSGEASHFAYALHACMIDYNIGIPKEQKNPTMQTLRDALENIERYLMLFAQNGQKEMKIALPLLGCGVGGLNKKEVGELYKRFFTREVLLDCVVVIYGYTLEDVRMLHEIFEAL